MRFSFIIFLLICYLPSFGQLTKISGTVIEKKNSNPIPYGSIYIEKTGKGTMTNPEGEFQLLLELSDRSKKIGISCIGYKTKLVPVSSLQTPCLIELEADTILLREVIIMPDSSLLTLLKRAYKKITINYSQKPVMYNGFYRETLKTIGDKYLYFSEAEINLLKNGYNHSNDNGQIKILKSRKNIFPYSDSLNNVLFYAGAFSGNTDDFVLKRYSFIDPKHFKKYKYVLSSISKIDGRDVYIIEFDTENDSLQGDFRGKLFLDKQSLAYIGAEFSATDAKINRKNLINITPYRYVSGDTKVYYIKFGDKWHIKFVSYKGEGYNSVKKAVLFFNNEFLVTSISVDSVKPIPYEEQFNYLDIFSLKTTPFEESFWKDYTVLEQDSILKSKLNLSFSNEKSNEILSKDTKAMDRKNFRKLYYSIASRFNIKFGLTYLPQSSMGGAYDLIYTPVNNGNSLHEQGNLNSSINPLSLNIEYDFKINKNWSIFYGGLVSVSKNILNTYDLGFSFRKCIKPIGKPLFLDISLAYSSNLIALNLGTTHNTVGSFTVGNKIIKASTVEIGIGQKISAIKPGVMASYKISKAFEMYLQGNYLFNLMNRNIIYFQEENGFFLFRSNSNEGLNSNKTLLKINNETITNSILKFENFTLGIGLCLNIN